MQRPGLLPKSADAAEYRRATGFEALFGWLALRGEDGRAKELFDLAFPGGENDPRGGARQ